MYYVSMTPYGCMILHGCVTYLYEVKYIIYDIFMIYDPLRVCDLLWVYVILYGCMFCGILWIVPSFMRPFMDVCFVGYFGLYQAL